MNWCSLEFDGLESLQDVTISILKLFELFSSPSNHRDEEDSSEDKEQMLESIGETEEDFRNGDLSDGGESDTKASSKPGSIGNRTPKLPSKAADHVGTSRTLFPGIDARLGHMESDTYITPSSKPTFTLGDELVFVNVSNCHLFFSCSH